MSEVEVKAANVEWIATLPADAPEQERVAAIRTGAGPAVASEGKARTITEQAKNAGTSRTLLYRAIRAGALRAFVPYAGGNQRITDGELARWLAGRRGEA